MGMQNALYKTQTSQKEKYNNLSQEQIEKHYVFNHFRVGKGVSQDSWMHSYLMKEILSVDNCEIIDYIYLKLNNGMKNKCNCITTCNSCRPSCNSYNTTTYLENDLQWVKIEW